MASVSSGKSKGALEAVSLDPLKKDLASRISDLLDERDWTAKVAFEHTGVHAAEFSRIRCGRLRSYKVDRLLKILAMLGQAPTFVWGADCGVDLSARRAEAPSELFAGE